MFVALSYVTAYFVFYGDDRNTDDEGVEDQFEPVHHFPFFDADGVMPASLSRCWGIVGSFRAGTPVGPGGVRLLDEGFITSFVVMARIGFMSVPARH